MLPPGATPLHYAAMYAQAVVCAELLAAGAALDVRDNKGKTPLHYSVMYDETNGQRTPEPPLPAPSFSQPLGGRVPTTPLTVNRNRNDCLCAPSVSRP